MLPQRQTRQMHGGRSGKSGTGPMIRHGRSIDPGRLEAHSNGETGRAQSRERQVGPHQLQLHILTGTLAEIYPSIGNKRMKLPPRADCLEFAWLV